MSDKPNDDLLVVMLDLDAGITALTGLGWFQEYSTESWQQAIGFGSIRYGAGANHG
jgi:hypothetical protein